jgi:cyclopropane-fatty-acyl-phospholipid synthase
VFLRALEGIREGTLVLRERAGETAFGRGDPVARVTIRDADAFRRAVFGGDVGLGEAYVDAHWEADDLVALFRVAIRNVEVFDGAGGILNAVARWADRRLQRRRDNSERGSRANIAAHYDLGNDFYRLFLDESLAYSCAVWQGGDDTLGRAQVRKYDRICEKLRLGARDHLLEIGTGWGGFAAHAALRTGCRVTTTTISAQQHGYAEALFRRLGLADRVTLLREDYRALRGTYDKVASIEMFEAVGLRRYDDYFGAVDRLLAPGGAALVQTITMNEQRFASYHARPDWIQKHVFPGAELASVSEVLKSIGRATSLTLLHLEDIGTHYARTLRAWRERFLEKLDAVRALGFDGRFVRTWEYYLSYCEAGFAERYIGDAQMLFAKFPGTATAWGDP